MHPNSGKNLSAIWVWLPVLVVALLTFLQVPIMCMPKVGPATHVFIDDRRITVL
jgi:hypothetical protein